MGLKDSSRCYLMIYATDDEIKSLFEPCKSDDELRSILDTYCIARRMSRDSFTYLKDTSLYDLIQTTKLELTNNEERQATVAIYKELLNRRTYNQILNATILANNPLRTYSPALFGNNKSGVVIYTADTLTIVKEIEYQQWLVTVKCDFVLADKLRKQDPIQFIQLFQHAVNSKDEVVRYQPKFSTPVTQENKPNDDEEGPDPYHYCHIV